MTATLVLATRNAKKLGELRRVLDDAVGSSAVDLVGLDDVEAYPELPESGLSFAENAVAKAQEAVKHTGLPAVADDSGLTVDVLNGMPGIFSARWCGHHGDDQANLDLLLAQISDVDDAHRQAAFVCAAALVLADGREFSVQASMPGRLIRSPRGDGGFGYDPIFVSDGQTRTNAELTAGEKDAISHRGKAFRALADLIATHL